MCDNHNNTGAPTEVGYKNPPKKHQFKKGNKGNPWGCKGKPRPPVAFLDEYMTATIDGRRTRVTRTYALFLALLKEAANGNVSAAKLLFSLQKPTAGKDSAPAIDEPLSEQDAAALERFIERQLKERAVDPGVVANKRRKRT